MISPIDSDGTFSKGHLRTWVFQLCDALEGDAGVFGKLAAVLPEGEDRRLAADLGPMNLDITQAIRNALLLESGIPDDLGGIADE